jgi:uncharacterized cupin superfamily protein
MMTPTTAASPRLVHLGRDGAALAEGRIAAASAADPFAASREILFDGGKGHRAGQVRLAGPFAVEGLGHAEFLLVGAGAITLAGQTHGAGSAFVLPRGFSGRVEARPGTLAFFVAQDSLAPLSADLSPVVLDPALPRNPSAGPPAAVMVGPPPINHSLNAFTDASGMRAGVWDVTTPCERTFVPHRIHELMAFIEGEVTLTHREAGPVSFRAGDVILVPQGAPYAWRNIVKVVKFYTVSG